MCYIECIWREANERSITFSTSECVAPIPPSPPFPIHSIHTVYLYFTVFFFYLLLYSFLLYFIFRVPTLKCNCICECIFFYFCCIFCMQFYKFIFFCSTHFFSIADCCWCTPECILVHIVCIGLLTLSHTHTLILLYYSHTCSSWIVLLWV